MSFDNLNLPADMAETLEAIYSKAKEINPKLTKELFIQRIVSEWLEPYRIKRKTIQPKNSVRLKNSLKQAIMLCGKSQSQIARETGISRSYLSQIINGKNEPSLTTALLIAEAVNYPPEKFKDLFFLEPVD